MFNKSILICYGETKGPTLTIDLTDIPEEIFYGGYVDFVDGSSISLEVGNVYEFPIQSLDIHGNNEPLEFYAPCVDLKGIDYVTYDRVFENICYWTESGMGISYYFCPADWTQDAVFKLTNFISRDR